VSKISINCRNITSQEHQEYSNRTPRDYHENTKSSSKASLLLLKRMAAIWKQDYMREMGREQERVRRNLGSMELLSNFMSKLGEEGFF
jgi:hypothetical protein